MSPTDTTSDGRVRLTALDVVFIAGGWAALLAIASMARALILGPTPSPAAGIACA